METVRWVLGVLLLLAGVGSFTDDFGLAIAYIAIGGALLPPVIPFIQEKFFRSRDDTGIEKDAWEADGWDFETAVPWE